MTSNSASTLGPASATHDPAYYALPPEPLIVIEPRRARLDLRDVWAHRELLYFLVWRDMKVRYKQTLLGALWVVMQPLMMTVVFTVFLGNLARVSSGGTPYALFAYTGLVLWMFFSGAVANTGNSLIGNAHLITKVYFPRTIIPLSAVGARLPDFAISLVILAGLMAYYGVGLTWKAALLPALILMAAVLALSVGMLSSALNVRYRDIGVALPVLLQFWMFASPVVYSPEYVPAAWQRVYELNPLVGLITCFRASVLGGDFRWRALAVAAAETLILLVVSAYTFRRMERGFVDIV